MFWLGKASMNRQLERSWSWLSRTTKTLVSRSPSSSDVAGQHFQFTVSQTDSRTTELPLAAMQGSDIYLLTLIPVVLRWHAQNCYTPPSKNPVTKERITELDQWRAYLLDLADRIEVVRVRMPESQMDSEVEPLMMEFSQIIRTLWSA